MANRTLLLPPLLLLQGARTDALYPILGLLSLSLPFVFGNEGWDMDRPCP